VGELNGGILQSCRNAIASAFFINIPDCATIFDHNQNPAGKIFVQAQRTVRPAITIEIPKIMATKQISLNTEILYVAGIDIKS